MNQPLLNEVEKMTAEEFTKWVIGSFDQNDKITLIVSETDLSEEK